MTADLGCARIADLTVIIPTRNEADNVAPLVARLTKALNHTPTDILFVDDSNDDTPNRIEQIAENADHPIRVLHRAPEERTGGLGSAVLAGLRATASEWAVVMDGDLQHPPELVPEMLRLGTDQDADLVVASRYSGTGSASGLSSATRGWVSRGSTWLSKALFPRRLKSCTDPMSGFFAVRPAALNLAQFRPNGFKILLEIMSRSPGLRVRESSFMFGQRHTGESKASLREGLLFVRRLISLRIATLFGRHSDRAAKIGGFAGVGLTGVAVNSFVLWLLVHGLAAPLLLSALVATQASTAWNFVLADRLIFRGPKTHRVVKRFVGFAAINNVLLLARLPLLAWMVGSVHIHYLISNVATLLVMFAGRYVLSDRILFTGGKEMTKMLDPRTGKTALPVRESRPDSERSGPVDLVVDLRRDVLPRVRARSTPMVHHYNIHGILTVSSAVVLKELEYFRTESLADADIQIEAGSFGGGGMRRRPRVTQYAALPAVSYEEHLGRRGSDFLVDMSHGIRVIAGPMLVRSPHVLYTNVIEALLRFVLVSRGYMLLHSACMDIDGHGVLLSALTDTGKTGTVLRLLSEGGGRFLSDDMTIIDAHGRALCYPKPLTISHHTLRAVNAGLLTAAEWRRLRLQSRLHSKEGRGIGTRLGEMNVPIMSLNALTQFVVPPPKYLVERLVPCEDAISVRLESLFVIERNAYDLSYVDPDSLIDELIANTDDAYGFPPYRYFAPAIAIGDMGYEELRAEERSILVSAMRGVTAQRLATPDFSWADHIPNLVNPQRQGSDESNSLPARPTSTAPTT